MVLTLEDQPEYGSGLAATPPQSRVRTRDVNIRERAVLKVWTDLLRERSRVLLDRLGRSLDESDREAGDGQ